MITVRAQGWMANQLFEYATARALCERTGAKLVFDGSYASLQDEGGFLLGGFNVKGKMVKGPMLPRWIREHQRRDELACKLRFRARRIVRSRTHAFDPTVLETPDHSYLIGYWQSEKYFAEIKELLREDFTPRKISKEAIAVRDDIAAATCPVALHVRRGNVADQADKHQMFGACTPPYFERGAAYIAERTEKPHFYVFSDDPAWCRENLRLPADMTIVSGRTSAEEDIYLMSRCDHFLISNSTFGWWGAWLGEEDDSIVVAPDRFFSMIPRDTSDIVPERWVRFPKQLPEGPGAVELLPEGQPQRSAAATLRDELSADDRAAANQIADRWRDAESPGFEYFAKAEDEEWLRGFWAEDGPFRRMFDRLDLTAVLELAAGAGRHSSLALDSCEQIFIQDTSPVALEMAKERFSEYENVTVLAPGDGFTLERIPDSSLTAIFSYDSMVSFTPQSVEAYIAEAARTLKAGGLFLLHHSAIPRNGQAPLPENPGWRNWLGVELLAQYAEQHGFELIDQAVIDWEQPASDGVSLLRRREGS